MRYLNRSGFYLAIGLKQGVILGAALQLLFIGASSVGNAIPPN